MKWIVAEKGVKNKYSFHTDQPKLTIEDLEKFLGCKATVHQYLSGEFVITTEHWKDYDNYGPNEVASLLLKQPVYGDCLILDPSEFDYENWLRICRRERAEQNRSAGVCEGEGTDPSGR